MTATVEFVPLKDFENDYEILNQYPFTIRKKSNHKIISEFNNHYGYPSVALRGKNKLKHLLIAKQFINNDDEENKREVDHINHDRTDYHIENLRWVSHSTNQKNKSIKNGFVYEYVDEIPSEAIEFTEYGNHQFENYYFHDNSFYWFNGINYRKLRIIDDKDGNKCVNMKNINNKDIRIYISKFKRLYNLI